MAAIARGFVGTRLRQADQIAKPDVAVPEACSDLF